MTDLIVGSSLVFAIGFFIVWLLRPGLRAWIERPKYRFLANVQRYEERSPRPDAGPDSH